MKGRGFTLLEVVIALSIMLALGALVMPAVSRRLGGARGDAAIRELRAAIAEARTDAIRESRPMRIELFEAPGGGVRVVSSVFEVEGDRASVSQRFVGPVLDEPVSGAPGEAEVDRVLLVLGQGSVASREAPIFAVDDGIGGGDAGERVWRGPGGLLDGGSDVSVGVQRVCLGVLLPTGGAVPGAPVYVTVAGSWTLEVVLDAWTGVARVTRWEAPVPEDEWEQTGEGAGEPER